MIKKILIAVFVMLMAPAISFACNYTFDISLVSNTVLDPTRSTANTLGFNNWYIWQYKIDVIEGGDSHNGLSNWVLELPQCYITSPRLFNEIEASAGWSKTNDRIRVTYSPDGVDPDPNAHLDGLKWDFLYGRSGAQLDSVGEYGRFWFSAPTNVDIPTAWSIKAGSEQSGGGNIYGNVEGPACPDCGHQNPGVPEPASLSLLGLGLLGLLRKKK